MPEQSSAVADPAAGPVSSRIRIDASVPRPTVAGTQYEDTALRAALRANNFRWRRQRTLWEYSGPAAERDAAVAAIREQVAAMAKPSYPPTAQQQAIIDAALAGQNVAVQALAGTGKTSTLRMVAESMPERRILYIAFNKTIAHEARQSMSGNVTAVTFNAYARRQMASGPYAAKIDRLGKGARHPQDIARLLNVAPLEYLDDDGELQEMAAGGRVQLAKAVVTKFRESGDREISYAHLPDMLPSTMVDDPLLETARQIWDNIADPGNAHLLDSEQAVEFGHDDYFKLWALSQPRIDTDLIFFDEAQDINDVQREVVQSQPTQTLVVGDTYQSIYGFRGAKDALKDWPADVTLPLTQSWRFGPAIAERGDDFLRLLGAPYELIGNPAMNSTIGVVDNPDAILCRTNVGAVSEVSRAVDEGKKVALVGGTSEISRLAIAAKDLKAGRGTNHPELSRFTHWWEVEEAAQDERALQPFVRLIEQHGPDKLLNLVGNLVEEDAVGDSAPDVVVSTAHKAKGREWRRVRISGDFHTPKYHDSGGIESLPSAEELRLSYVAVTRGQDAVSLGSLEWIEDAVGAAPVRDQQLPALSAPGETAEAQPAPEPAAELAPVQTPPQERQPSTAAPAEPAPGPATGSEVTATEPDAVTAPTAPEPTVSEQEEPERPEPVPTVPEPTVSEQEEPERREPLPEPVPEAADVDGLAGQDPPGAEGDAAGQGELPDVDDFLVLDAAASPGQAETSEPRSPVDQARDRLRAAAESWGITRAAQLRRLADDPGLMLSPSGDLVAGRTAMRWMIVAPVSGMVLHPPAADADVAAVQAHLDRLDAFTGPDGARIPWDSPDLGAYLRGANLTLSAFRADNTEADNTKAAPPAQEAPPQAQEVPPAEAPGPQTAQEQPAPSADRLVWTQDGVPADQAQTQALAPAGDDQMLDEGLRQVTEALAEQAEQVPPAPATNPDPTVSEPPIEPAAPEPVTVDDQAAETAAPGDDSAEDMPAEDVPDPQPAPFARYPDLQEAVERLKRALADRAEPGPPREAAPLPAPRAADDTELTGVEDVLAGPLAEAQAHLGAHARAPEWRRIAEVAEASRVLGRTITGAAGSYRREVADDIRVRGFWRAVTARCARVIAASANGLANQLDRGAALAIKALRRLGRAANDYADQLQGNLPPGRNLQTAANLKQSLTDLDAMLDQPAPPASNDPSGVAVLLENSMNAVHQALTGARAAVHSAGAAVTGSPAWQRLTSVWNGAASVVDKVRQGALRFERDAFAMGFLKAVWTRTCETVSWSARQAMEHMADNGRRPGPAWQALRLLHHTAEETIAHLRDRLPHDQYAPLGTYDPPSIAEVAAQALQEVPAPRSEAAPGPQDPADRTAIFQEMIAVLDAIDLARQYGELDGGFGAVADRTEQAAERMGLRRIGQIGDTFDPNLHDGVELADPERPAPDDPVAVQILRPGYMVDGSLVRPASVKVGSLGDLDPETRQARDLMVMSRQGSFGPADSEAATANAAAAPAGSRRPPGPRTDSEIAR